MPLTGLVTFALSPVQAGQLIFPFGSGGEKFGSSPDFLLINSHLISKLTTVGIMRGEGYLTKREQYTLVAREGSSWADGLLVMRALSNGLGFSRYGISVSKRVGTAVVRNRVKRLLREILRVVALKPGTDIVFIARTLAATANYAALKKSVEGLLSRANLLVEENEGVCLRTN